MPHTIALTFFPPLCCLITVISVSRSMGFLFFTYWGVDNNIFFLLNTKGYFEENITCQSIVLNIVFHFLALVYYQKASEINILTITKSIFLLGLWRQFCIQILLTKWRSVQQSEKWLWSSSLYVNKTVTQGQEDTTHWNTEFSATVWREAESMTGGCMQWCHLGAKTVILCTTLWWSSQLASKRDACQSDTVVKLNSRKSTTTCNPSKPVIVIHFQFLLYFIKHSIDMAIWE